nr:hypothetical protein BaRGS_016261 [Batillaria attramentaria]
MRVGHVLGSVCASWRRFKKLAQDCLAYMQNGSELVKVRSNSRQYHRFFSLNNDVSEIRWQPTSKKPHKARRKRFRALKEKY